MTTPVASSLPVLVTAMVYVTRSPGWTGSWEAVLETWKAGALWTVVVTGPVWAETVSLQKMPAVFVRTVPSVMGTVSVTTRLIWPDAFPPSVPRFQVTVAPGTKVPESGGGLA